MENRDMRPDGEYDRPLPERIENPTKEDREMLRQLVAKHLDHIDKESPEYKQFVQQVEEAVILSVLNSLAEKKTIPRLVYENAVELVYKQGRGD